MSRPATASGPATPADSGPPPSVPGLVDGCVDARWGHEGSLILSVAVGTGGEAGRIDCVLRAETAAELLGMLAKGAGGVAPVPCGVGVRLNTAAVHWSPWHPVRRAAARAPAAGGEDGSERGPGRNPARQA